MARHLYEALGVSRDATQEEIRKAYRKKALQTHPDRLPPGASEQEKAKAGEQFRKVNNAYEVLQDEEKRRAYDQYGEWPPPEQPEAEIRHRRQQEPRRHTYGGAFDDQFLQEPFFRDPFFSDPFRTHSRSPYGFTDPFELFDSIFGDLRRHFNDPFFKDPFFNDEFDDRFPMPGFGRSLFGNGLLSDRTFGMLPPPSAFPALNAPNGQSANFRSASRGVFTRGPDGNGQWVAQSTMTRTINGVTETVQKRRDANGNEHVTYKYPDGHERYLINGVEQPSPIRGQDNHYLPPPPPYPGPSTQPLPPPTKDQRPSNHDRGHSHERRASESRRYAPPPNPPADPPVIPPANQYNSANEYYRAPQGQYSQPAPYNSANMKRDRDYERVNAREHRRRQRDHLDERDDPHQRRKWWSR